MIYLELIMAKKNVNVYVCIIWIYLIIDEDICYRTECIHYDMMYLMWLLLLLCCISISLFFSQVNNSKAHTPINNNYEKR